LFVNWESIKKNTKAKELKIRVKNIIKKYLRVIIGDDNRKLRFEKIIIWVKEIGLV
jgi:hypothetical protein